MALKQRRWSGAALAPASFAKGYLCLLETWDANPAAAGKLKKERVRGKRKRGWGKGALIFVWRAVLVLEKPGASLMPNPGAVGLGKAKDVIKEKPPPACCV